MTKAVSNTDDMRQVAKHCLVGFVCDLCEAARELFLAARTIDGLRAIVDRLTDAVGELLEVADLRGDADLPHPCDDDKLWTARMGDAWDEMRAAAQAAKGDRP